MIPKKYQVIVFLVIMAVSMMMIRYFYGYKGDVKKETVTQISPTPTINEYPIKEQLPYQGKGFVVEKYTAPKTLRVVLSNTSTQSAVKAINTWLESFGEAGSGHYVEFEKKN